MRVNPHGGAVQAVVQLAKAAHRRADRLVGHGLDRDGLAQQLTHEPLEPGLGRDGVQLGQQPHVAVVAFASGGADLLLEQGRLHLRRQRDRRGCALVLADLVADLAAEPLQAGQELEVGVTDRRHQALTPP
ncbi:hypothetical protein [Amycolatopsis mediterranei]|uniref:Uncharacterized protein n=1 Tax=Amycolatopsis mediterranei (strain S699) TaxID=713604 RepID=A0A9R0P4E3_AMYMS|nr:hypothetical protein [Amycolatopsis mediterranei]AEK45981.1 hypothetical protein RAM_37570 [Amycolatopsis mediterranei S699]UZF74063.1 hypothetical protein ISP_007546 [Amycolatopsis mediterranei]